MTAHQAEKVRAASAAYKKGQLNLAFDLYEQVANEGHAESQVFVAWMLSNGIGCARNEARAATYYERAAALGSPIGSFYFARWLTMKGDHVGAFSLYSRSAKRDYLPSIFRVGYSLARGNGVDVDRPAAYEMLKTAALQGHAYALREMAVQDLRGGRGLLWVPVGLIEFLLALCWGVGVALFNKDSDLLRG